MWVYCQNMRWLPLLGGEAESFPCRLHDLPSLAFILRPLEAKETTQLVFLLRED